MSDLKLCKDCKWAYNAIEGFFKAESARCGRPKYQKQNYVNGGTYLDGPLCSNERLFVGENNSYCSEVAQFFEGNDGEAVGG